MLLSKLVLQFLQMLSIHERHECGIPVIIEGETGVGKTALINMLSKLWNYVLTDKFKSLKEWIRDLLLSKSSSMYNVMVITWARSIWLIYMPEPKVCRPKGEGI